MPGIVVSPAWFDFHTWKLVSHHVSAVIPAILGFKIVYWLVAWGFPEGIIKTVIHEVDTFVLAGLLLLFAWRMLRVAFSWLRNSHRTENYCVLA